MALDDLLDRLERAAGTAGTADVPAYVPANPLQTLAGTAGTAGTAETNKGGGDCRETPPTEAAPLIRASGWVLHFVDRDPLKVWFAPAVDHDEALMGYPDAVAAEPLPEPVAQSAQESAALGCSTCRHRKRPGLSSPGYCGGRDDLPGAYGAHHPLRKLPDDLGASCASYQSHE